MRRLDGWAPATRTWADPDGVQWSQPEPELDWVDLSILRAWWELQDQLCPLCGRPRAVHDVDETEVNVGYDECPYTVALLRAQTAKRLELDEQRETARKTDKTDPEGYWAREQALTWTAWTTPEGPPPT